MEIELTIPERLHLLAILPKESNFLTLKLTRDLVSSIGLSKHEFGEFEIKEVNGIITWNEKGITPVRKSFSDAELELIRKELRKLDAEFKLTSDTFTLYEKFCN